MNQLTWDKMNDHERWRWIQTHQGEGFVVKLDNDQTFLEDQNVEDVYYDFDDYVGWSEGVVTLMNVMGIECEFV